MAVLITVLYEVSMGLGSRICALMTEAGAEQPIRIPPAQAES